MVKHYQGKGKPSLKSPVGPAPRKQKTKAAAKIAPSPEVTRASREKGNVPKGQKDGK